MFFSSCSGIRTSVLWVINPRLYQLNHQGTHYTHTHTHTHTHTNEQTTVCLVALPTPRHNDNDGHDHPVAYFSRKLLPREVNYSAVEKECLAIKLGVQAFQVYLLGRPFTIQTDHRALQYMAGQSQGQSQSFNSMELSITAIPISSGAQERKS